MMAGRWLDDTRLDAGRVDRAAQLAPPAKLVRMLLRTRFQLLALLSLALAVPGQASEPAQAAASKAEPMVDALPPDASLTGKQIYERTLENRLDRFVQKTRLVSGDRGGSTQQNKLTMTYRNYRDENDEPTEGVLSKTHILYTDPFDIRMTAYLIIDKQDLPNDQFVYLPEYRRVRRVSLRGEAVAGTDFSFEDVIPRELYDSEYRRLPDEMVGEIPCFVVEATPKPETDSQYSRFVFSVEKEHHVPIYVRYWDEAGVEFKKLEVDPSSIEQFAHAWIPLRSKMTNLRMQSFTQLFIDELDPDANIPDRFFTMRRLEQGR